MTNREIIDALKRDGADRIRREARVGPVCRYGVIEQIVHGIDAAAKMLAPEPVTDPVPQTRPREKCPVCGREMKLTPEDMNGNRWVCYHGAGAGSWTYGAFHGPREDRDGSKVRAQIAALKIDLRKRSHVYGAHSLVHQSNICMMAHFRYRVSGLAGSTG